MIKKLSIIASVISTLTLTTAFAADGLNAKTGFYIGGAFGSSYADVPAGTSLDSALDANGAWMYGFGDITLIPVIGYRFNDHFALEATYNDLVNDNNQADGLYGPDHYRLWTATFAGKLILPFNDSDWSFYTKGGFAVTHQDAYNQVFIGSQPVIDSDTTRAQPLLGVGITYNFTQSVALDIGATNQFRCGITPQINTLSAGLDYTF